MKLIFILLVIYQFKHLICDYFFQGEYMLGKFKPDWSFVKPLLAHVGVHAYFTFVIAVYLVHWPIAILLGIGDAAIHFVMDRIKAGPKYMGRWKSLTGEQWLTYKNRTIRQPGQIPHHESIVAEAYDKLRGNVLFWWALGIDQMVHHLTHYGIIYLILLFH